MLQKISAGDIFTADYGWYSGRFHFSYAEYEDPQNLNFGVLRALNEFVLQPDSGFDTHPHEEMEILSYCVRGELTHGDSLGYLQRRCPISICWFWHYSQREKWIPRSVPAFLSDLDYSEREPSRTQL